MNVLSRSKCLKMSRFQRVFNFSNMHMRLWRSRWWFSGGWCPPVGEGKMSGHMTSICCWCCVAWRRRLRQRWRRPSPWAFLLPKVDYSVDRPVIIEPRWSHNDWRGLDADWLLRGGDFQSPEAGMTEDNSGIFSSREVMFRCVLHAIWNVKRRFI